MKRVLFCALVALTACAPQPAAVTVTTSNLRRAACPSSDTQRIYDGLKPHCEGCHSAGARGFFSSSAAFESLLVQDPRLVTPGHPDDSELIRLLEGRGMGAFTQMPIGGQSYAQLVSAGQATLSVDEIRAWITGLSAAARDNRPNADAPTVTRMKAHQMQRALYDQLGLGYADFFMDATNFGIAYAYPVVDDRYPLQSPDAYPAGFDAATRERFFALGGGSVVTQTRPDNTASPTFVQTLTQVSQAWCRMALRKQGNTALFPDGSPPVASETEARATIRRWHLHFLGSRADDAAVDDIYSNVYVPLVDGSDVTTAYTGVCSFFIRHPAWIFY